MKVAIASHQRAEQAVQKIVQVVARGARRARFPGSASYVYLLGNQVTIG